MAPRRGTTRAAIRDEVSGPARLRRARTRGLGGVFHVERLVGALVVVAVEELVEAGLLLEEVSSRGLGGSFFKVR